MFLWGPRISGVVMIIRWGVGRSRAAPTIVSWSDKIDWGIGMPVGCSMDPILAPLVLAGRLTKGTLKAMITVHG